MKGPGARIDGIRIRLSTFGDGVPIPLGVREIVGKHGRVRRHGIDAPMNEDAELCIGKPGGRRAFVERFPVRLVSFGCSERAGQEEQWQKSLQHVSSIIRHAIGENHPAAWLRKIFLRRFQVFVTPEIVRVAVQRGLQWAGLQVHVRRLLTSSEEAGCDGAAG